MFWMHSTIRTNISTQIFPHGPGGKTFQKKKYNFWEGLGARVNFYISRIAPLISNIQSTDLKPERLHESYLTICDAVLTKTDLLRQKIELESSIL